MTKNMNTVYKLRYLVSERTSSCSGRTSAETLRINGNADNTHWILKFSISEFPRSYNTEVYISQTKHKVISCMWERGITKNLIKSVCQYVFIYICCFLVARLATPWTAALQTPLSMGFPRQEYWSGLPFPSPGDCADPGIEPVLPALAGRFFSIWAT